MRACLCQSVCTSIWTIGIQIVAKCRDRIWVSLFCFAPHYIMANAFALLSLWKSLIIFKKKRKHDDDGLGFNKISKDCQWASCFFSLCSLLKNYNTFIGLIYFGAKRISLFTFRVINDCAASRRVNGVKTYKLWMTRVIKFAAVAKDVGAILMNASSVFFALANEFNWCKTLDHQE